MIKNRRKLLWALAWTMTMTLAAFPAATADHDGDPIPDAAEAAVCGFPAVHQSLAALPQVAGRCVGSGAAPNDYVSPILAPAACPAAPAPDACRAIQLTAVADEPLTPGHDVDSVALLPFDVQQPVGTLQGRRNPSNPQSYCVTVVPEGGSPMGQCVDLGLVAPLVTNVGPIALVDVREGAFGSTDPQRAPETTMDLELGIRWVEDRLNQRLGPGLVNYWEPVDLDREEELSWWTANGEKTTLDLRIVIKFDGVPQRAVELHVPYAGQSAAALLKSQP